jgi:hypothetical protein
MLAPSLILRRSSSITDNCRAAIFAAVCFYWRPKWPPHNFCFASMMPSSRIWFEFGGTILFEHFSCVGN